MDDPQVQQVVPEVAPEVEQVTAVEPQEAAETLPTGIAVENAVIAAESIPAPLVPHPRIAELEAENGRLQSLVSALTSAAKEHADKIERLRTAKNAYRKMASFAAQDMAGAHSQGDIYSSRRKLELAQEFQAIKDED